MFNVCLANKVTSLTIKDITISYNTNLNAKFFSFRAICAWTLFSYCSALVFEEIATPNMLQQMSTIDIIINPESVKSTKPLIN